MNWKKLFLPALIAGSLAITYSACKKNDGPLAAIPAPAVNVSITGRVLDENRAPMSGATVTAGTQTATTDVNGNFSFTNINVSRSAAYVRIEKNGYFSGSRTFVAYGGSQHFVEIQMIRKNLSGTFNAGSGGTVNTGNGGSVQFGANAIAGPGGAAYTGTVSLSAFTFDPSSPSFAAQMPGELRGTSAGGQEQGLVSYAMMAIELNGANGEALNLAAGKTATITFPIPATLQALAPATIPLWFFDENSGLWKEEGSATKQGGVYVGTVGHFSYWNCDVGLPLVNFDATFRDAAGNPLPQAQVRLRSTGADSNSTTRVGYTDQNGHTRGQILANRQLQLTVRNRCGQVIHQQIIGPYSTNTSLGTINTTASAATNVTISGTVTNCNNTAVSAGFVNVLFNGMNYRANVSNGSYSIVIPSCTAGSFTASAFAFDATGNAQGSPITVTGTTGTTTTANLTACGTSGTQFVSYDLQGSTFTFAPPADSLMAGYSSFSQMTYISTYSRTNSQLWHALDMTMNVPQGSTGTFPVQSFQLRRPANNQQQTLNGVSMTATISAYGQSGGFIEGTYTGTVRDTLAPAPVNIPISGTFRVRRN